MKFALSFVLICVACSGVICQSSLEAQDDPHRAVQYPNVDEHDHTLAVQESSDPVQDPVDVVDEDDTSSEAKKIEKRFLFGGLWGLRGYGYGYPRYYPSYGPVYRSYGPTYYGGFNGGIY